MKIVVDNRMEYPDVVSTYYNIMKHNDDSTEEVFFQGYYTSRSHELKNQYKDFKKRIYLNLESPTGIITSRSNFEEQKYFTHVYTICPYTAEMYNKIGETKFIPIPFPISLNEFNNTDEKIYDVLYMGRLMPDIDYGNMIDVMRKYKYAFISPVNARFSTHQNITTHQKWDLLSKSKICVGINQAELRHDQISKIKSYEGWETNKAFNSLDSLMIPQFKSRVTEGMAAKSIVLIKKDKWNVIEHWFKPNVHFLYWEDAKDLDFRINHIIKYYDQYQHIVDNAYEEVKKYDIDYLFTNEILK